MCCGDFSSFPYVRIHIIFRTIWIHVSPLSRKKNGTRFSNVFVSLCWEFYFIHVRKRKNEPKKKEFLSSYVECHERKIQNRDWCVFCANVNEQMNMLKKEIQIFVFFLLSVIRLKKKRQKQQRYIVTLHAWLGKQLDFNNRESPPFKAAFLSTWCTKFCMTLHFDFFSFLLFFVRSTDRFVYILKQYASSNVFSYFLSKFN